MQATSSSVSRRAFVSSVAPARWFVKTACVGKQRKARLARREHGYLARREVGADGSMSVPIKGEMAEIVERQFAAFEAKFGRLPGPEDPLFFDPTKDEPVPFTPSPDEQEAEIGIVMEAMLKSGIEPRLAYAYWKTGRMVTTENSQYLTDEDLLEWEEALEEWDRLEKDTNQGAIPFPLRRVQR